MSVGKVSDSFFHRVIQSNLGKSRDDVRVGPWPGVDAAIVDIGGGRVLAVAEDPIFIVPGVSLSDFGWYTVHIGASDVAVTGIRPTHMTYSLLLPPATEEATIAEIVEAISRAASELGIAIIGGHTGYAPVVLAPIVGGITVFGAADRYVSPAGARPGDCLVMTKGPAIEATGILARQYRDELLAAGVSAETVERAARHVRSMSVVRDAEIAFASGGVHAMHDATEGGVVRGVCEMAWSARAGLRLDASAIVVPPEVAAVCSYLGIDPLHSISEGTLLAAVEAGATGGVIDRLRAAGIDAFLIGEFVPEAEGIRWRDGSPLAPMDEDPFWSPFFAKLGAAS